MLNLKKKNRYQWSKNNVTGNNEYIFTCHIESIMSHKFYFNLKKWVTGIKGGVNIKDFPVIIWLVPKKENYMTCNMKKV